MTNTWKRYSGILLSNLPPHAILEKENVEELPKLIRENNVLFARYTTDFDCGYETEWWYCIKDDKMSIQTLPSKKRYIINRGLNYINVVRINPTEHKQEIFSIMVECYKEYPATYQPKVTYEEVCYDIEQGSVNRDREWWGCIDKMTGVMCGYAVCVVYADWVSLSSVKVDPAYLSKQVNAALGYSICMEYLNGRGIGYISDGERNIRHQTNYQEYLIKYFGFRKAYCKLHVVYRPAMGAAVKILYPFRKIIKKMPHTPLLYNISCTLEQERICRLSREQKA